MGLPPGPPERPDGASPSAPGAAGTAPPSALLGEVKDYVARHYGALSSAIEEQDPRSGGELLGVRHAKIADGLLRSLFAAADAAVKKPKRRLALALGAVGSYGRGAVALRSDLDVRFVLASGDKDDASPVAEAMLYPLWDAGLTIGHQIVTTDELLDLARDDLPSATSILDWRHLAGDVRVSDELCRRARERTFGDGAIATFLDRLDAEVAGRHGRFGGSVYLLEPDVKNGAGGLRDVDVFGWAAAARWGGGSLADLVRLGVVVQREATRVTEARELLWRIRNRLHLAAGRRADRLTFEQQERLATTLGYGDGGAAVEALMSDYYRAARAVTQLSEIVLRRAKPIVHRRKPHEEDLGRGLRSFDGHVTLADVGELAREPALAFRLFHEAVVRGRPVFPFARDAVARATEDPAFAESLRASPEAAQLFVELATTAQETKLFRRSVLGELHDVGLLTAMVPEFSPVVGRVHHDVYHVYTVDVHSVAAVDRLRALARGDLADEHPLACRLAAETSRPVVLYLATLLHDVGKAIGGKDHAIRGADMVIAIGERLGLAPADVDQIQHLVRTHLSMYHVATRRDLDDPSTIEEFLRDVRGRENLRELYLLTVADLSTTSPTAMTSWKARLLDELYLAGDRFLAGSRAPTHDEARAKEIQAAVLALVPAEATARAKQFLAGMPERYLLANAPDAIASHVEVAERAASGQPAVALRPLVGHGEVSELCVIAADRPGLLAQITAAIVAARLEVHAAQIHSHAREDGTSEAVDLFWVRGPGIDARQVPHTLRHLERDLGAMMRGERSAQAILEGRGRGGLGARATPRVDTQVSIDDRAVPGQGIIEVLTRDRPGVLYALAQTLHDLALGISLAKINTEGSRVADVFYVTDDGGTNVPLHARADEIRAKILGALDSLGQS